MKLCKKCNVEKDESFYYPTAYGGLIGTCKECKIKENKIRKLKNGSDKKFWNEHKNELNTARRVRRLTDQIFKQRDNERCRKFRKENPEWMRNYRKKWELENKLNIILRKRFKRAFKTSSPKIENLIGCSLANFKFHLESQFESWMTWDNYTSKWTIDHILPVSMATEKEDMISTFHFCNCRPLKKEDNSSKNSQILPELINKVYNHPDCPSRLKALCEKTVNHSSKLPDCSKIVNAFLNFSSTCQCMEVAGKF